MWISQSFAVISMFFVCAMIQCGSASEGSYCYDCHYDPDEDKTRSGGWGPYAGNPKCSMRDPVQQGEVDRWECLTGKCFIRKDPNGLLYRGCADPANLPWEVNPNVNCEYQGQIPSIWYFCDGHLCNGGRFEAGDICSGSYDNEADANSDSDYKDTYIDIVHGDSDVMGYNQDYAVQTDVNYEPPPMYDNGNRQEYSGDDDIRQVYPGNRDNGPLYPGHDLNEPQNGVDFEHYHELYRQQDGNYGDEELYKQGSYQTGDMRAVGGNTESGLKNYHSSPKKTDNAKTEDDTKKSYGQFWIPQSKYPQQQKSYQQPPSKKSHQPPPPPSKKSHPPPPSKKSHQPPPPPPSKKSYPPPPSKKSHPPPPSKKSHPPPPSKKSQPPPPKKSQPPPPSKKSQPPPPSKKSHPPPPSKKSHPPPPSKKSHPPPPSKKSHPPPLPAPKKYEPSPPKKSSHASNQYENKNEKSAVVMSQGKKSPEAKQLPESKSFATLSQKSIHHVYGFKSIPYMPINMNGYRRNPNTKNQQNNAKSQQPHYKSEQPHYKSEQPHYKSEQPHYKSSNMNSQNSYEHQKPMETYPSDQNGPHENYESYPMTHYKSEREYYQQQPESKPEAPEYAEARPDPYQQGYGFGVNDKFMGSPDPYYDQYDRPNQFIGSPDQFMGSPDVYYGQYARPDIDELYVEPGDGYQGFGDALSSDDDVITDHGNSNSYHDAGMDEHDDDMKRFQETMLESMKEAYRYTDTSSNQIANTSPIYNPCDGRCHDNPSGLYAVPGDSEHFIQCGDGVDHGKACRCCQPYYLACPRGTRFDDVMRVCDKQLTDAYS